jgi:hypothetical protein
MGGEIQIISDGDGLALIGDAKAVERFLATEGLPSKALDLPRLSRALSVGSQTANAASSLAAGSGRWVKLTEESFQKAKTIGLMKGSSAGLSRGIVQAGDGKIKSIVEFTTGSLANPAVLAGVGGLMAQMAMEQAMNEITDYLAVIDAKVDDILRAQKDAVLADMIGAGMALDEAMTLRAQVGRVSEVTWSKVQTTSMIVARTQAYALRQLDALAEKVEKKNKAADLAKASKDAEEKVFEWLAVLARSVQLQDAFSILELDRVLDASPADWDQHRIALKDARQKRLELIANSTIALVSRLDTAVGLANAQVLLHPVASKAVAGATNEVAQRVLAFNEVIGAESSREALEAKRWSEAAIEVRDGMVAAGAEGVETAKRIGGATFDKAKAVTGKVAKGVAERARPTRADRERGLDTPASRATRPTEDSPVE